MCGIAGYINSQYNSFLGEETLRKMSISLAHRGPDDEGMWFDERVGVALCHRRLSILDLSPTGHQPMISFDERYVIVFNGEIYNYRDLRKELEQLGRSFRGSSDTEVILEACSVWGVEGTIPRLWGMFAIALWDRVERQLILARDRLGKKPLYYGQIDGIFMFGSELKALRAHPAFHSEIDRDALALYLRHGYVPAPYSIYKKVRKLPQGYLAILRPEGSLILKPYWEARQVIECGLADPSKLSDAEAADELEMLLRDATARRMIADVPLGALLSGGVDSSTVVALMQSQSSRPIKTFTIGFYEDAYNEAEAARKVANHLGTDHTELYVTPNETQAVIPRLAQLYDEPFADSSQIPTFLVCELTRQHVTVGLSGDGGDELFGGYNRYVWAESIWYWLRHVPTPARRCIANLIQSIPPRGWNVAYAAIEPLIPPRLRQRLHGDNLHKLSEWLTVLNEDELYHRAVSQWKKPEEMVIGGREPMTPLLDPSLRQSFPNFTERMMYLDLMTYLPDDILVKVDRASMAVSLETRNPLLDHRVVEWVWRLPFSFKNRDGQSKWVLRQVLYRYVPSSLIERPKMGFGIPMDVWLRGPLRDWAESLLEERRLRQEGFFCTELIRHSWDAHLSGRCDEQHRLWIVLMFQAWYERWFKN